MRNSLGLAAAAILLCAAAPIASTQVIPKSVTIQPAVKQPAVTFNHEKHSTTLVKTCETCHHMNKGMTKATLAKSKVVKCSTCHLNPKGAVPSMREISPTKNPFHKRCITCHKEQKKGPTVCKDCHVKK
jgi:hypothetical protein